MNFSVRSSRVTGPKIRVPTGSSFELSKKTDERAVGTTHAFGGADHNSVVDLTLLDATARGSFFYRHLDDVTDVCIAALGAAQHLKTHY